ncbi:MAG: hypothetical protein V4594_09550 [Bacteroidota bacterium]
MHFKKSIFFCLMASLLVSGLVSSCKKKDSTPDPEQTLDQPKGKLKSFKEGSGIESVYVYKKDGQVDYKSVFSFGSLIGKIQYVFVGGKLQRSEYTNLQADGSMKLVFNFVYEYQREHFIGFTTVPVMTGPATPRLTSGKYTYDGSGKLSTYALWSPVDDPVYVQEYPIWQSTFDAKGNIVQMVQTNYDKNGKALGTSKTKYEYDDKPNPWYLLGEPENPLVHFSVNNIVKMTYEGPAGATFMEQYTYEYNAEGKPSKKYKTFHNVTSLVNEFSYY